MEFKQRWIIGVSSFLILFFIFTNLYTIHPTVWDPRSAGVGGAASKEDFALAQTVDFSRGEFIGYQNDIMTVYETQKRLGMDISLLLDATDLSGFEWIIINRAGLDEEGLFSTHTRQIIAEMKQLDEKEGAEYNRMYESNNLAVLQRR